MNGRRSQVDIIAIVDFDLGQVGVIVCYDSLTVVTVDVRRGQIEIIIYGYGIIGGVRLACSMAMAMVTVRMAVAVARRTGMTVTMIVVRAVAVAVIAARAAMTVSVTVAVTGVAVAVMAQVNALEADVCV